MTESLLHEMAEDVRIPCGSYEAILTKG